MHTVRRTRPEAPRARPSIERSSARLVRGKPRRGSHGICPRPGPHRIRAGLVAGAITLIAAAAGLLTGCGATSASLTTAAAVQVPIPANNAPRQPGSLAAATSTERYATTVDAVCAATLRGSPSPPASPTTAAGLRRYALAAKGPLSRTYLSLTRLPAPAPARSHARDLAGAYQQLASLAGALARGNVTTADTASDGLLVQSRESAVNAAALLAGVPACAIVNPQGSH
jgi:hypothetical protein